MKDLQRVKRSFYKSINLKLYSISIIYSTIEPI